MADAVAITGKPTATATNFVWSREGKTITLTWELTDSNATSDSNPNRVEWIQLNSSCLHNSAGLFIGFLTCNNRLDKNTTSYSWDLTDSALAGSFTYRDIARIGNSSIILCNSAGRGSYVNSPSLSFNAPNAPTVDDIEYDYTTGKLTFKIEGSEAIINKPRITYHMKIIREGIIDGGTIPTTVKFDKNVLGWDSNTEQYTYSTEITDEVDLQHENDQIYYTLEAYAVGMPKNSKTVTQNFKITHPACPFITKFEKTSGGGNTSVVSNSYYRTTQTLQLQIQYANKPANLSDTGWTNVGDEYSYNIQSLPLKDSDVNPEAGQHVFLRVMAGAYGRYAYSSYFQVDDQYYYWQENYHDSEDESVIKIVETSYGQDSESLEVVIGYDDNANYDACLLSYSTDDRAWTSTKQPETFEMPDSKWQDSETKSTEHPNTSSISILELEADTTYYLRARRYKTTDSTRNTRYSVMAEQSTSQEELTGLVLTAGDIVATGKECSFSWSFPEGLKQSSWTLKDADTGAGLASSTGSVTLTTLIFSTAGAKNICLDAIFSDGRSMTSNTVTVNVADAPTLKFETSPTATVTALPQTFKVTSDNAGADIQVKVSCVSSIKAIKPNGDAEQYTGDVIYSAQDTGAVECSITDGSKLWNNGRYTVQAVATANGVKSDTLTANFTVNYSAKLGAPTTDNVTITTTADKTATVTVNNLDAGITWDLYRATADQRNALVASGLSSGASVLDSYAPYALDSACKYIVLVKNSQQQYAFAPYEYTAEHGSLRFDWENKSVELPYNIEISDETDKQFEQQVYLDGTQRGTWGASVVRTANLSTDTIYIKDVETQKLVRELARYQGAVFVRTPLGQAYCANVDVKDISKQYDKQAMAVSFDCTEIDLTSDFMATISES